MKNSLPQEILEKLKSAKKVLISLHNGPDGDSLGCCMAMKYLLERDFNKEVTVISSDNLPDTLEVFDFNKEIEFGKKLTDFDLGNFDVILFLDHGVMNCSGEVNLNFPKDSIVNIDHHPSNSYYGDLNYVDSLRPSACSVLIDLFREWDVVFDKELSTRLLIGVYTDSGYFSHDNGGSLRDAVFLIDKGADYLDGIVNKIKYNVSLKTRKYFSLITNKFRVKDFEGCKVGVSAISEEDLKNLGLNLAEIRGGINYLQEIGGLDFLFTLVENGDLIKGSFRSRKKIDVSLIAKELGGGGHKVAATFKLPKMSLEDAEKKVFETIKKVGIHKV